MTKRFLQTLNAEKTDRPPFWLMRQAGRYLPEYRALRSDAGGFLDMVYDPAFATEVTLQPIRRFGMDAAILFSDILVIPQALGQKLTFVAGEGPKLDPVRSKQELSPFSSDPENLDKTLSPIYQTIKNVRKMLVEEGFENTALIGFAGSPWTVATYMVEGGGSKDFARVKHWAYADPDGFGELINLIAEATIHYLDRQIEAGAEAVQLFDSWCGVLEKEQFEQWVIAPTAKITAAIKQKHPTIKIIGFPKGAAYFYTEYAKRAGIDVIGLDSQMPLSWAAENLQPLMPVQGNLDPACLLAGGDILKTSVKRILNDLGGAPFVFNLGHGVIKETPPEHVGMVASIIKGEL
jgi:uroporphyrinogen decarboxylase